MALALPSDKVYSKVTGFSVQIAQNHACAVGSPEQAGTRTIQTRGGAPLGQAEKRAAPLHRSGQGQ